MALDLHTGRAERNPQLCLSGQGELEVRGRTPTTVKGDSFSVIARPIMLASLPKRRCHNPWLKITVRSAPGLSSSGRNARP